MNPRERVLCAFEFREPDRLPYTLTYGDGVKERITAYYGGDFWERKLHDHILRITMEWEPKTALDATHYRDLYGAIWQQGNPLHLVESPLKQPSLRGYEIPEIAGYLDLAPARAQIEAAKQEQFVIVGYGFGFFERCWMLRGYENFCMDLYDARPFVEELLDQVMESQLRLLDRLLELPCDAVIFSDDFSDQRGVILGPGPWRELIKPRYAKLYRRVHDAGKMTVHHSCGNVADIAGDLAEIGLDVLQSLQPEAMDVYALKRKHGRKLRFWGGLGTQRLLPFGTPQEVREEVLRLAREMGRGGGYVFSGSKAVLPEVPVENAAALIEAVLELHGEKLR